MEIICLIFNVVTANLRSLHPLELVRDVLAFDCCGLFHQITRGGDAAVLDEFLNPLVALYALVGVDDLAEDDLHLSEQL